MNWSGMAPTGGAARPMRPRRIAALTERNASLDAAKGALERSARELGAAHEALAAEQHEGRQQLEAKSAQLSECQGARQMAEGGGELPVFQLTELVDELARSSDEEDMDEGITPG